MRIHTLLVGTILLPLVVGMTACLGDDECGDEDIRCDGTVLHRCEASNAMYGGLEPASRDCAHTSQECAVVTENGHRDAICVESAIPDPRCPAGVSTVICSGNEWVRCSSSYRVDHQDCGSEVCKEFSFTSGCVDPSDPCAEVGFGWLCEGDKARECEYGGTTHLNDCRGCYLNDVGAPVTTDDTEYPGCG